MNTKPIVRLLALLLTLLLAGTAGNARNASRCRPALLSDASLGKHVRELMEQREALVQRLNVEKQRLGLLRRGRSAQKRLIWELDGRIHRIDARLKKLLKGTTVVVNQVVDTVKIEKLVVRTEALPADRIDALVDSLVNLRLRKTAEEPKTQRPPAQAFGGIVYKVQFCATRGLDPAYLNRFPDVSTETGGNGWTRYFTGHYATFSEAVAAMRRMARETPFRDAYVVAFQNGRQVTLTTARLEEGY